MKYFVFTLLGVLVGLGLFSFGFYTDRSNDMRVAKTTPKPNVADLQKNIVDKNGENLTELLVGVPYSQNPDAYVQSSPFHIVPKNAQPTLLLYGDADQIVNFSQGEKLFEKLKTLNVKTAFKKYSQGTHDLNNMNDIFEQTTAFMKGNGVD